MKPKLTILLLLASLSACAQADMASVYYQALQYYENQLSDLPNSKSGEIFIEEELGITEKFPDRIGSRRITVMKWDNKEQVYARNGNKLMHLKMFAAEITGDLIEVNLIPYQGEYKGPRKGYFLVLSDWLIIQFKYDCDEKKFKYLAAKYGGI